MRGLSNQEIKAREAELRNLETKTDAELQEEHELSFREWVNSCLIYKNESEFAAEHLQEYDSCFGQSTLELFEVELDRALEIVEEQKERFKDAVVSYNVYTDSEGCSYNSCEWK